MLRNWENELQWCSSVLGSIEVISNETRPYRGGRAGVQLLRTPIGECYLKVYQDQARWEIEVHAYEQWASYLNGATPKLIAVRDQEPFALLISRLPGLTLESKRSTDEVEEQVWRRAGEVLRVLHDADQGQFFGACQRDGRPQENTRSDAETRIRTYLTDRLERGIQANLLSQTEIKAVHAALDLSSCFDGEPSVPCHGDYCPANWLVASDYSWQGVIDFEMSGWDVRVWDLARFPDWEWIERPNLSDVMLDAYGLDEGQGQQQQLLIARTQYALSAVVWGYENEYHGFAREGHQALAALNPLLIR